MMDDDYWAKVDKAEAEYFAHVEGITHDYPRATTSSILIVNESISGEVPF